MQIDALRELCREHDIRTRLGKLPKTLKTAYDELYLRIQSQEGSTPTIANRAFQWVMCSCWPLSPAELVAAVCQDPDTDEIDEVDINIDIVLGACQNLLVVDQESNVCRFSHLSVQEYLESYQWNSCEGDCLVGKVCLSLLISNLTAPEKAQSSNKEGRKIGADYVLEYAQLSWIAHIQRLEQTSYVENRLTALLKCFLGSMDRSSLSYRNWYDKMQNYHSSSRALWKMPWYLGFTQLSTSLWASFAIVTFGFYTTLLDWWTVGFADINQKNSLGHSLLHLGATSGSESVVGALLKKGADVNATGGMYGSALQAASYSGHESIVQLLLDKGADVNATGGCYGSALQAASYHGHKSIVTLLLDKGADVNAAGGRHGSALQAASYQGREPIVQLLLDKGAGINAAGGRHGSALQAASDSGHKPVVQLLLEKGAVE